MTHIQAIHAKRFTASSPLSSGMQMYVPKPQVLIPRSLKDDAGNNVLFPLCEIDSGFLTETRPQGG